MHVGEVAEQNHGHQIDLIEAVFLLAELPVKRGPPVALYHREVCDGTDVHITVEPTSRFEVTIQCEFLFSVLLSIYCVEPVQQ